MKKILGFLLLAGLLSAQGVVWAEEVKPAVPAVPAEEAAAVTDEVVLDTEGVIPGPATSDIVDAQIDKEKKAAEDAVALEEEKEDTEEKEETEEKY